MSSTTPDSVMLGSKTVKAGAGAGKTTNLTHHVLTVAADYFEREKQWPRLVVTTFTRKATQELRERLLLKAVKEKPELIGFVQSSQNLLISTLHGVMDQFLRFSAPTLNLSPAFEIWGDNQLKSLQKSSLREILFSDSSFEPLLDKFSINQLAELWQNYSSLQYYHPHFHSLTKNELEDSIRDRFSSIKIKGMSLVKHGRSLTDQDSWLDFFSQLQSLLHLLDLGSWNESYGFFAEKLDCLSKPRKNKKDGEGLCELSDELLDFIKKDLGFCVSSSFDPNYWSSVLELQPLLEQLCVRASTSFERKKSFKGVLSLSELENKVAQSVKDYPELAVSFSEQWDYWLVDEFQDTSPLQVSILEQLIGNRPRYIVGDPQQSIYLFRGARSQVFLDEAEKIKLSGGEEQFLNKNYRSHTRLMNFMNKVVEGFGGSFDSMQTRLPEEAPLFDEEAVIGLFSEKNEELQFIGERIAELSSKGVPLDQICVLARSHNILRDVSQFLAEANIPYFVHSSGQFGAQREIQDSLSFLKFLLNPHNNFNLVELLRSPWCRLNDQVLAEFSSRKNGQSLWKNLQLNIANMNDSSKEVVSFLSDMLGLQEARGFLLCWHRFSHERGLFVSHLSIDPSGQREANLWKLHHMLTVAVRGVGFNLYEFIDEIESGLQDGEGEKEGIGTFEVNRVQMMTIHASKGLEFAHVILPQLQKRPQETKSALLLLNEKTGSWSCRVPYGLEERRFALPSELESIEALNELERDEALRVLYVALTRASQTLTLSWSGKVESRSFAEAIQLNFAEGRHDENSFSYVVRTALGLKAFEAESTAEQLSPLPYPKAKVETSGQSLSFSPSSIQSHEKEESYSVTALVEQNAIPQKVRVKMAERAAIGTLVHRLMELLKYPTQDRLREIVEKWFPDREGEVLEAINFVRMTKNPALLEIIHNGKTEWGFLTRIEGQRIEGQIDLWGRDENGQLWIVDYKSGSSQQSQKAILQMRMYTLALLHIFKEFQKETINLVAVYPFEKKVVEDVAPTYGELLEQFRSLLEKAKIISN